MSTVKSYGAQLTKACYLIGVISAIFTFDIVSTHAFAQITPDGTSGTLNLSLQKI